jgi:hypothetical protein
MWAPEPPRRTQGKSLLLATKHVFERVRQRGGYRGASPTSSGSRSQPWAWGFKRAQIPQLGAEVFPEVAVPTEVVVAVDPRSPPGWASAQQGGRPASPINPGPEPASATRLKFQVRVRTAGHRCTQTSLPGPVRPARSVRVAHGRPSSAMLTVRIVTIVPVSATPTRSDGEATLLG